MFYFVDSIMINSICCVLSAVAVKSETSPSMCKRFCDSIQKAERKCESFGWKWESSSISIPLICDYLSDVIFIFHSTILGARLYQVEKACAWKWNQNRSIIRNHIISIIYFFGAWHLINHLQCDHFRLEWRATVTYVSGWNKLIFGDFAIYNRFYGFSFYNP